MSYGHQHTLHWSLLILLFPYTGVCSDQDPWFIPVRINYPMSLHMIEFIPDKAQFALKGYEKGTKTPLTLL